ncbi:MAG: TolB family protein [Thermoleophilia bacterium]
MRGFFSITTRIVALILSALIAAFVLTGCSQLDRLDEWRNGKTQTTVKVTAPPEMQSDAASTMPAISADGRFVAFRSDGTNLVIAPANGASAIYVKDVKTGKTVCVSSDSSDVQGNQDSGKPDISADGRLVVFDSSASNLVADDTNNQCVLASGINVNCVDVFLKDTETGVTTRLSTSAANVQGDRESTEPVISDDGRFVAFKSAATNLVPGDGNGAVDIFLKDTQSGAIQLVSTNAAGAAADAGSTHAAISADGRFVAFSSTANNLVPDDTNGQMDVFVKDTKSGAISRVSTGAAGQEGDNASGFSAVTVSSDGRFVAFESAADNLVPGDTNGKRDIFVKDTQTGALTRASVDAAGSEGVEDSYNCVSISGDGRLVVFRSDASNLVPGDTNARPDIFLKDMQSGAIKRISTDSAGAQANSGSEFAAISDDGGWVAFDSAATNLISGDTNGKQDIFLKDNYSGATTRVSTSTSEVL